MSVLIFDCETTSVKDPRLVEAAWVAVDEPSAVGVRTLFWWSKRYNPGVPITYGAMATHHITDEDVAECQPATEFRLPADTAYLIGHNIDFDYQVAISCGPQPTPKRICTLALCRALWPETDSHTLMAMLFRLDRKLAKETVGAAHSAAADVSACLFVLEKILEKLPAVTSWADLWAASEIARVPTVMTFGKHKGVAIKDVPRDYRDWLRRQPDVDPYLLQALSKT